MNDKKMRTELHLNRSSLTLHARGGFTGGWGIGGGMPGMGGGMGGGEYS